MLVRSLCCGARIVYSNMRISRADYEAMRQRHPERCPAIEDSPRCVVSNPQHEQDPVYEFVAADAGKTVSQGRTRIVVTSYRLRIIDDDNLPTGAKPLVDGLIEAGFAPSDAPIWCKIEHRQEKVERPEQERTEIQLEPI